MLILCVIIQLIIMQMEWLYDLIEEWFLKGYLYSMVVKFQNYFLNFLKYFLFEGYLQLLEMYLFVLGDYNYVWQLLYIELLILTQECLKIDNYSFYLEQSSFSKKCKQFVQG